MENSPTDGSDADTGSFNEDLPVENQNTPSADEQIDTQGDETQGVDQSDTEPQDGTTQQDDSSDDDGLSKFAKAQGFDPENLTDNERKALKLAHENQKAFRKTRQEDTDEARDAIVDANKVDEEELDFLDENEARMVKVESENAQLNAKVRVSEFYQKNPDARDYDVEMGKIIAEEVERNGKDAARYLAADLNRLYVLAKARKSQEEIDKAREEGRLTEREMIRRRQEASADTSHASNSHQSAPKIDEAWLDNEYDPSNPEHRLMVDEALARGDLY